MGERYLDRWLFQKHTDLQQIPSLFPYTDGLTHMHDSININESHGLGHFDRMFNRGINLEKQKTMGTWCCHQWHNAINKAFPNITIFFSVVAYFQTDKNCLM